MGGRREHISGDNTDPGLPSDSEEGKDYRSDQIPASVSTTFSPPTFMLMPFSKP